MNIDASVVKPFVEEFAKYGFWGIFLLAFVIFGMKHVAPIITALGSIFTNNKKIELSHKRSMAKISNKTLPKKSSK